jgi:hypothetical protein
MNIYLDIDGVLLTKDKQPALYVKEFVAYLTKHTPHLLADHHCKGDANSTLNYISQFFDTETIESLKKIQATDWKTAKTEAIDFSKPFLWFDDYIFDFEKQELAKHDCLQSWIKVDLLKNVEQLRDSLNLF